jgi:hypothetical protein
VSTPTYGDENYDAVSGTGWIGFAAVVMFAVGFFRIISAISYFANSAKVNNLTNGLFSGHTWGWGLWDLLIAAAALVSGTSLLAGGGFGRVIAYIWAVLMIVQSFAVMNVAPWYGAFSIILASLVIYGLASTPRDAAR